MASDMDICKGKFATTSCEDPPASDPPPPQVVEITPEEQMRASCIQKRVSFIPGQELGGRRRSSYLDGKVHTRLPLEINACTATCALLWPTLFLTARALSSYKVLYKILQNKVPTSKRKAWVANLIF